MSLSAPFDRTAVRTHRARIARTFKNHDFLLRECAIRLSQRLIEFDQPFRQILDLGCHSGELTEELQTVGGIEDIFLSDVSSKMTAIGKSKGMDTVVAEEELLPFAPGAFDAVVSCMSLHWVNDLPGTLSQIFRILRPGGLLLASFLGGETLRELRGAFLTAENTLGLAHEPRTSPFIDVRDAGNLMTRAKFLKPVADIDTITAKYHNMFHLMSDLRGMGETNACRSRTRKFSRREIFLNASEIYENLEGLEDKKIPATFQIVTITGWTPESVE